MARISHARVRGGAERRAPPADRPARAGWAALRQFLFREFFLEIFPATLVSRATRNRTDPLAPPAGRRRHFLNSGWGLVRPPRRRIRWCGRRRRASAARYGVDFDTTPIETALNWALLAQRAALKDQQKRPGVYMARISRVRVRGGAERRAPPADRPARAGWAALRQFLFREFFLEIFPATLVSRATRNRTDPLAPPAGRRRHFLNSGWGLVRPPRRRIRWCGRRRRASAARYGVDFDTTPIETALNWGALALARAMGGTERSAEKTRRVPQWRVFPACACEAEPSDALRQQTDPLEPAGRRFANLRQ